MTKNKIKLLLVENDTVIRTIYQQVLQKTASNILLARNGEEGFNIFQKEKPDLILTDIRMPLVNGLDMIKKIRQEDKSIRIIIISAYSESRYFTNAIELGVKGFLTKPIKNDHLQKVIQEQVKDILLERNLEEEEKRRIAAEQETKKSDIILNSLSEITATIFQQGLNDASIDYGLKQLGEATQSTKIVIIQFVVKNHHMIARMKNIWRLNEITSKTTGLPNNEINMDSAMLDKWYMAMKNNNIVGGNVSSFEDQVRVLFEKLGAKSLFLTPIFVNEDLWGGLVIENSEKERVLSKNEAKALKMVAYNFGAAIYRKNVEKELINMNINLERRVNERTKALEIEIMERSNAQSLLKDSEEKYRLIYENASTISDSPLALRGTRANWS